MELKAIEFALEGARRYNWRYVELHIGNKETSDIIAGRKKGSVDGRNTLRNIHSILHDFHCASLVSTHKYHSNIRES